MTDGENKQNVENGNGSESANNYIDAIKDLKAKEAALKEENAQLNSDNKKLLNTIVNGQEVEKEETVKTREPSEIIKDLQKSESNLDYVKKALEYRASVMERTGKDVFSGELYNPKFDSTDADKAQNVADVLQQCIDDCDGDSTIFTALLQSRMNDTKIPPRRR